MNNLKIIRKNIFLLIYSQLRNRNRKIVSVSCYICDEYQHRKWTNTMLLLRYCYLLRTKTVCIYLTVYIFVHAYRKEYTRQTRKEFSFCSTFSFHFRLLIEKTTEKSYLYRIQTYFIVLCFVFCFLFFSTFSKLFFFFYLNIWDFGICEYKNVGIL